MVLIAVSAIAGVLAYLYLILSFSEPPELPSAVMVSTDIDNGVKLTISSISKSVAWVNTAIVLFDQTDSGNWTPTGHGLTNPPGESGAKTEELGSNVLGSVTIWCNVTDLDGNGIVSPGDYFTLTTTSYSTFFSTTPCAVGLICETYGTTMCYQGYGGWN